MLRPIHAWKSDLGSDPGGTGGFGGGNGSGAGGAGGGGGGGGGGLGGVLFSNGGTLALTNDTFTANTASGGAGNSGDTSGSGCGGAVFVLNGSLTANFDTFSGNTANQGGTDVYVLGDQSDSGVHGGGTAASVTLTDDILGQNGTTTVTDLAAGTHAGGSTPVLSGSNNLIGDNGTSFTGVLAATNPQLGSLALNGGPTPTMALLPGSPAIGAGLALAGITTDQRGVGRANPPDMGAYEFTLLPPIPTMPPSPPTPGTPPRTNTPSSTSTVPPPLPQALRMANQLLFDQVGRALSLQSALANPQQYRQLALQFQQANAAVAGDPLEAQALLGQEFRLAYDLALFADAPGWFAPNGLSTWLLAVDVLQTSAAIAANPLSATLAGYLDGTLALALDVQMLTTPGAGPQSLLAALAQTLT